MSGYSHPASSIASTTNGQLGSGITAAAGAGASSSSAAATAAPFSSRVSDFVERNRRALIIAAGAGVVVAGGAAGYYYYTRPPPAVKRSDAERRKKQQQQELDGDLDAAAGDEDDAATGAADKSASGTPAAGAAAAKKKKKKSRKSTASAGGSTSSATAAGGAGASAAGEKSVSSPTVSDGDSESEDPLKLTSAQLAALPIERRKQIGADLKTKGNKAYSGKKFDEAIEIYSKAIECDEQAVYYSNRAACYTNLNKNEEVVKDCTDALRLDPSYVKALNRRGSAQEALGGEENLFKALCDFTAGAIIDGFQNESMAKAVDRVMKQLAQEKGSAIMRTREPRLPSPTFIKAYMEAFRNRERPTKPSSPSQGDETLFLAFDAVDAKNYPHAFSLFNEAIEQGISDDKLKGRALNMRGTFKFIIGDAPGALSDMEESVSLYPEYTQTWVKKASVHMELSDPSAAFAAFEDAAKIDDADPDIYYHRGQVYFITGQFQEAIGEYRKSTELDDRFVFSQIQLAVAMYKNEQAEKAMHMFKKIIRDFGEESPEVFNYYGEILLDRGEFTPALENLDKAIALEKTKTSPGAPTNVLPMVNKALCLYQSRQALPEAEAICREALQHDPSCDIAVATLGQLLLQQNKVHEAVEAFQQSAEIARTEPELVNALAYENATRAQLDFIEKYPEYAHKLGLAQGRI